MNYTGSFSLEKKAAVVTGALGILGRHFCRGLAEAGAGVAVVDLDEEAAALFAAELSEKYGTPAVGIGCDITSAESVGSMVARVRDALGGINILHNNAAASKSGEHGDRWFAPFEEYMLEEWRRIMAVNIDGMFLVAQAVSSEMIRQGRGGSIIQTSSIYGIVAPDQRIYEGSEYMGRRINTPAVYSASKGAVVSLSRYLSTYLAPHGIRVNTITPGGVRSGQNDTFIKAYSNRVPLGRMGEPEDMVGALLFLASDASRYVTGQNIVVDGGLSVW